jgi:hypothetical protein
VEVSQNHFDTHDYRFEGKRGCGLLPGLVLSRLVAPPLQLEVVGPYPVRDVWFLRRLLMVETGCIQNFEL